MTKLFVLVENMVKRYQSGHTVEVDSRICPSKSSETNGVVTDNTYLIRNASTMKWKKLARETYCSKTKMRYANVTVVNLEDTLVLKHKIGKVLIRPFCASQVKGFETNILRRLVVESNTMLMLQHQRQ
jgi:hypothetical protein